jgi:hypothetical protein
VDPRTERDPFLFGFGVAGCRDEQNSDKCGLKPNPTESFHRYLSFTR